MNKKYYLIGFISMFVIVFVSAVALDYYAQHQETLNIIQPISVNEIEGYTATGSVDCEAGDTCEGTLLNVNNKGSKAVPISVLTQSDGGVTTSYNAETTLTEKTVDFSLDVWEVPEEASEVTLSYAVINNVFQAEVTNPIEGYELVYYKDNSDRFNSPAQAVAIADTTGNLPYENDKNTDEYDYCETEEYVTCHGAKVWYVPSNAITEGNLDWSRATEFYFETELIQFNSEGKLIIYPGQDLGLVPSYYVSPTTLSGEEIVTTTITL